MVSFINLKSSVQQSSPFPPTRLEASDQYSVVVQAQTPTPNMKSAYNPRALLYASIAIAAVLPPPVATGQTTASPRGISNASSANDETVLLDVFEVKDDKDYGYLKTNSMTATRIAANIQEVPLNISVVGEQFIKDTNIREISDVLRFVSGSSGDNRMGIRAPGNSATPSGFMKLRGFPISQRLRNSVARYTTYSVDNVDRIEVIKGPAAIFFGLGYPGGVINYVTKKPVFGRKFTDVAYEYGGSGDIAGTQRVTLDQNVELLSSKVAMRIVGAWDNMKGDQRYEYQNGHSITPSFTIVPFDSKKLRVNFEFEHMEFKRNMDDSSWLFNEQVFKDYYKPSDSLLRAAGIDPGAADKMAQWQAKCNGYNAWVGFKRTELNDPYWASYQTAERGAFYYDLNGNRVHDREWNTWGSGSWAKQVQDVFEITVDAHPFEWLSLRYVYTKEQGSYEALTASANPSVNGNTFNYSNLGWRKDERTSDNHQLDIVLKASKWGMDHKLLLGGLYYTGWQQYYGNGPFIYNNIPGASIHYDPTQPPNGTSNLPPWFNQYNWGLAFQEIKNRAGVLLDSYQLFTQYDPAIHVMPDINRVTMTLRNIVDRGNPRRNEQYINYQGDFLKNKLHVMGGYRWTESYTRGGQAASANPPWYVGYPWMNHMDPSLYNAYGIGSTTNTNPPVPSTTLGSYYLESFAKNRGESWMVGASYDIKKDITAYVSRSQSFRPVSASGAIYDIGAMGMRAAAIHPQMNASDAAIMELARIRAEGADKRFAPEKGLNTEIGVKTSLWDNKLVATVSLFQLDRQGEALDDIQRQQADPMNYTGPNKTGDYKPTPVDGGIRWYSNSSKRRVEGVEFDATWTPTRNIQVLFGGSWLWKAKTLLDTSINTAPSYLASITAAAKQAMLDKAYYTYDFRMPGVPEYTFYAMPTYAFTHGPLRGLRGGLGMRYTSEMNVQNSNLYDSKHGGLTAGNFVAFNLNLAYPWEVGGFKFVTSLAVTNLFDSDYCEGGGDISTSGGFNFAPRRTWVLSTALKF
jgi:outer membrane receptor protein involved in Fe transport